MASTSETEGIAALGPGASKIGAAAPPVSSELVVVAGPQLVNVCDEGLRIPRLSESIVDRPGLLHHVVRSGIHPGPFRTPALVSSRRIIPDAVARGERGWSHLEVVFLLAPFCGDSQVFSHQAVGALHPLGEVLGVGRVGTGSAVIIRRPPIDQIDGSSGLPTEHQVIRRKARSLMQRSPVGGEDMGQNLVPIALMAANYLPQHGIHGPVKPLN